MKSIKHIIILLTIASNMSNLFANDDLVIKIPSSSLESLPNDVLKQITHLEDYNKNVSPLSEEEKMILDQNSGAEINTSIYPYALIAPSINNSKDSAPTVKSMRNQTGGMF